MGNFQGLSRWSHSCRACRGITDVFPQFGIPLSDKATVKVDIAGQQWTITEAPNQINAGTRYIVRAEFLTKTRLPFPILVVFTPDIIPGWASGPDRSSRYLFSMVLATIRELHQWAAVCANCEPKPVRDVFAQLPQ